MIEDVLKSKLIEYVKTRDLERVGVLRYLLAKIQEKEIDMRTQDAEFGDEHVIGVVEKQIKQRKDSIEAYRLGGRQDLVDKEEKELKILQEILAMFTDEQK